MTPAEKLYDHYKRKVARFAKEKHYDLHVLDLSRRITNAVFKLTILDALRISFLIETRHTSQDPLVLARMSYAETTIWESMITTRKLAYLCTRFKNEHIYEDLDSYISSHMEGIPGLINSK